MSSPWWDRDPSGAPHLQADPHARTIRRPVLFPTDAGALADEIAARRGGFTPTWTSERPDDPGLVLAHLVGAQVAVTAKAIGDLTIKARVDLLRAGGITPLGAAAMTTLVAFEVSPTAEASVAVAAGFRVTGRDRAGEQVTFETDRDLVAAPARLVAAAAEEDGLVEPLELPELDQGAPIAPFGSRPRPGNRFLLCVESDRVPGPRLALAFFAPLRDAAPPPVALGGLVPGAVAPPPLIAWEILDGQRWTPVEVLRDEIAGFQRTGVVELRVGGRWADEPGATPPRRWLRATLVRGRYEVAPELAGVAINAVPATAGETRRDEILAPIEGPGPRARTYALPRGNVLPGTLVLSVDEGGGEVAWERRDDLSRSGPGDRHFVLDPVSGRVTFGDGERGRMVPAGFRHVRAVHYRVLAPSDDVEAGALDTLAGSAPFLVAVTNPRAPSGQRAPETLDDVLVRGPKELRARGRAVTPADYEVCALSAGAIRRAFAIPGHHPLLAGRAIPGVVGVLVVPAPSGGRQPPLPDEETLRAVARHLVEHAAPAGIEVVTAAPRYQRISAEAEIVIARDVDGGAVIAATIDELNTYFDPLRGGDDGRGWPFGGSIVYVALIRRLLERVRGLRAIARLNLVLDGIRSIGCQDRAIEPRALLWPEAHQVVPTEDAR